MRTEYFELLSKCYPNFPELNAEEDEVFPNMSIGLDMVLNMRINLQYIDMVLSGLVIKITPQNPT